MPAEPYRTLDGSLVTELVRPESEGSKNLSLALAVIDPGTCTLRHSHRTSEEVYYILRGHGLLQVGGTHTPVAPGEAHLIPAGTEHSIGCVGAAPLEILCACAPPYRHEDTAMAAGVVT